MTIVNKIVLIQGYAYKPTKYALPVHKFESVLKELGFDKKVVTTVKLGVEIIIYTNPNYTDPVCTIVEISDNTLIKVEWFKAPNKSREFS
jgi:hypothetical protein